MTQIELGIERDEQPDRNFNKGGRSFYFFDLDENVFFLSTPTYIFHKDSGRELPLTAGEFAKNFSDIGRRGEFKDYVIIDNDVTGSFRRFRDYNDRQRLQPFIEDMQSAITKADFNWKGPSWSCFYHASFNQRPISLITARGHAPETIKAGIDLFVRDGHLPKTPNYLSVFPVSHPETQGYLSQGKALPVSELKLHAVIRSVELAMQTYGENPHHRFGMSDDDPKNLEMIFKAMLILKKRYPENSFFVIRTGESDFIKEEVFLDHTEQQVLKLQPQLPLFNSF
jgi:hypothetical protein